MIKCEFYLITVSLVTLVVSFSVLSLLLRDFLSLLNSETTIKLRNMEDIYPEKPEMWENDSHFNLFWSFRDMPHESVLSQAPRCFEGCEMFQLVLSTTGSQWAVNCCGSNGKEFYFEVTHPELSVMPVSSSMCPRTFLVTLVQFQITSLPLLAVPCKVVVGPPAELILLYLMRGWWKEQWLAVWTCSLIWGINFVWANTAHIITLTLSITEVVKLKNLHWNQLSYKTWNLWNGRPELYTMTVSSMYM